MLPRRQFMEMTWTDLAGADTQRWIAVLPVAAIEQHGPHLPLGVDSFIAQAYLDRVHEILPANLPEKQIREIQHLAVACYQAVECEGMARVDFLIEASTQKIYINEINTVPGFTSISMFARMWEAAGLPYAQLLDRLIDLALERHRERQAIRYTR